MPCNSRGALSPPLVSELALADTPLPLRSSHVSASLRECHERCVEAAAGLVEGREDISWWFSINEYRISPDFGAQTQKDKILLMQIDLLFMYHSFNYS